MACFDVYRPNFSTPAPLLVDVQAELLSALSTRVIIPLVPYVAARTESLPRLKPVLTLGDEKYLLMTADTTVVHVSEITGPITNLEDQRTTIIDAIDFLLQGF